MSSKKLDSPSVRSLIVVILVLFGAALAVYASWNRSEPPVLLLAYLSLIASSAALFKESVADWIWGPKLSVSYQANDDHCEQVLMSSPEGQNPGYYFRLLVRNLGHRRAENVEVFAKTLTSFDESGQIITKRRLFINLIWTHRSESVLDGISPRMERYCDIGFYTNKLSSSKTHLIVGKFDMSTMPCPFFLFSIESNPNHFPHMILKGSFRLDFQVSASNCRPVSKTLWIDLTGNWAGQAIRSIHEDVKIRMEDTR